MAKKSFIKTPIEISARHIHLTQFHFEKLFGKKEPTFYKKLGQSQFAAKETVTLRKGKKTIKNVRLVAPFRKKTQVELSFTDAINIGIKPVLRLSGNLKNTPGIELIGPKGRVYLKDGVIVAKRHLHLSPSEAQKIGLKHKDVVSILVKGKRALLFGNVIVRVKEGYNMCVHLDTDEGNAAGIFKKGVGYIVL